MEHKHIKMERKWNTNGTQKIAESLINKQFNVCVP
jgi:hypothetical protein